MSTLTRRGFLLGNTPTTTTKTSDLTAWQKGFPVLLKGHCLKSLPAHSAHIAQTELLVSAVLDEKDCDEMLAQSPYVERLEPKFQSLGSVFNAGDPQEIETVTFDVMEGEDIIAEDLWLKASWLSFHDDDASLRFRFSFGIDLEQDVALDPYRQQLSAELTDAVFPESAIITQDQDLQAKLKALINPDGVHFVERIIYFNAPNGGAYFHHDLERGHAGVVFAQLTGSTFWLALPKETLVDEILHFAQTNPWPASLTPAMQSELNTLITNRSNLTKELDSLANDTLIHLINETEAFIQFLITRGHSTQLNPGDILLLPQANPETCCWHSVFCIGEEIGEALSFAIR